MRGCAPLLLSSTKGYVGKAESLGAFGVAVSETDVRRKESGFFPLLQEFVCFLAVVGTDGIEEFEPARAYPANNGGGA